MLDCLRGKYTLSAIRLLEKRRVDQSRWVFFLLSRSWAIVTRIVQLKIEEASALAAEEQTLEDEISDPDEDTLAGQMAAMRGGSVKKAAVVGESSDDESSTDESEEDNSTSSDSD